ncbi:MAG: amidohydrolase family protein [Armatimonadota bacterium]|nr:amidohydrolase family protein [Armatimonadota bacterium]
MIFRPDAIVFSDGIRTGLEVCFSEGVIAEIRPWTSELREESGYVLSPKFVNAHSHFEYYDLIGAIEGSGYWEWIAELTVRKAERDPAVVKKVIDKAARLNVQTGVWAVGEWSDWEGSDESLTNHGLQGCIFQELITFREWTSPADKLAATQEKARRNKNTTFVTPHATYTVVPEIISALAATGEPLSIHVSETQAENDFYLRGDGPIKAGYDAAGIDVQVPGTTAIGYLDKLGALGPDTQLVHVCASDRDDLELLAQRGCSVAHCPRSNSALGCPPAPIGEMLDQGIRVGLGMDSAASSGVIDMFAEMREAVLISQGTSRRIGAHEAWAMAISTASLPNLASNDIAVGTSPTVMLIRSKPDFPSLLRATPRDLRPIEQGTENLS